MAAKRRGPLGVQVGRLRREPGEQNHVGGLNGRGSLRSASGRGGGNVNRFVPAFDSVDRIEHRRRNERRIATADNGIDPAVPRATSMCSCQSVTSSARTAPAMASGSTRSQQAPAPNVGKEATHDTYPFERERGLRYNGETSLPSAQTERRGGAGPVRDLLDG